MVFLSSSLLSSPSLAPQKVVLLILFYFFSRSFGDNVSDRSSLGESIIVWEDRKDFVKALEACDVLPEWFVVTGQLRRKFDINWLDSA